MQAGKRFADREAFSFPLGYYFEIWRERTAFYDTEIGFFK